MSIHINADKNAIADKVLLPGDPLRAKHIAETFLEDVKCYNTVRNMLGFTGTYKGKRVSIQGTGMGMPSISIYANELMTSYGIKTAIRVGTCGSIHPDIKLRDVLAAVGAATDSNMNLDRFGSISFAPTADFELMRRAYEAAKQQGITLTFGNIYTSDKFYDDRLKEKTSLMRDYGVIKRCNGYAILLAAGICLAVWLGMVFMLEAAFIFGAISFIFLLLLLRESRCLHDATLIWDNRIIVVPFALISIPNRQIKKDVEETVVSTFGILMGSEIYRWGLDGIYGVRLHTVHIDQERMYLTFGDAVQTMRVELLHGMTGRQAVLEAAEKLLYETGVTADITGW